MKNKKLGFSLIELMVVVAIVGLLSAVAVPMYRDYVIKTKVATAYHQLRSVAEKIVQGYEKRVMTWPTYVTVNGVNVIAHAGPLEVNLGDIKSIAYYPSNIVDGQPNQVFTLRAYITKLDGIPGYITPTSVSVGERSLINMVVVANSNGTFQTSCGVWPVLGNYDIPQRYHPASCQCTSLAPVYIATIPSCNS